jgi:hypothetical protein
LPLSAGWSLMKILEKARNVSVNREF